MCNKVVVAAVFGVVLGIAVSDSTSAMTLDEAIRKAVATNPRIGEAAANRRAVEQEVRQVQGGLLPQVRLQASTGIERNRRFDQALPPNANNWRAWGGEGEIVLRQLLFDSGATVNEIYRQMARADSAAWRTMERSELVALDTVEAYLDILRFSESVGIAQQNLAAHERLLSNVQARFSGGRAGAGDSQQVRERVNAARAILAELRIKLDEARALFRRSVGIEPPRLRPPSRLAGLPTSAADALRAAVAANPTLLAARSDVRAVEHQFDAARGAYGPTIAAEARASYGSNQNTIRGRYDDVTGRVVMNWTLFDGGTAVARRSELAERVGEAQMRYSVLQRNAKESIERAWAVRVHSGARINSLATQVQAAQRVISAYRSEYELGQRTLLDLLNAENAMFNARLSLAAARGLAVFADYQLIAATGQLLQRTRTAAPIEARVTPTSERSLFPAPLNLRDPEFSRTPR